MNGAPVIFGEALFDCFEDGKEILGGAPFNVAWHLQALGDAPLLVSRVGEDDAGSRISSAMQEWGMSLSGLQTDQRHPTGKVQVRMSDGEPTYTICEDAAYDFIEAGALRLPAHISLVYHGTLALRSPGSRRALQTLLSHSGSPVFIDVNLRAPWWAVPTVHTWLERARWCKLNQQELTDIDFNSGSNEQSLANLQERFPLEHVILTRGDAGAMVRTADGWTYEQEAVNAPQIVDSVGAGDAFTAMYIHGLLAGWPVTEILSRAQKFASAMLGQRGGIVRDRNFYDMFI